MRKTLHRVLSTLTTLTVAVSVLAVTGSPANAQDYSDNLLRQDQKVVGVEGFNRGMIISDEVFYNPNTMSQADIERFIAVAGRACVPGKDVDKTDPNKEVVIPCLKDYRQDTPTRPADAQCIHDYQGGQGESAAQIVFKVSQACQINPQVLLVLLQKEQSLLTASGKYLKNRRYDAATGMGCPDTAACDEKYSGFFNQVYNAANRFHYYRLRPENYRHRAGRMNDLLFSPKRDKDGNYICGTTRVFIENQATAGLYNYTPYTPNDAALRAGSDTGDECSSYGNRNFFRFFTRWFGSPGVSAAIASARLYGSDRVTTAAVIAQRAYPGPTDRVYLARADKPVDAMVGGTLSDGPILLVPVDRPVPQEVLDVIAQRDVSTVVALGGQEAIPDSVLAQVAGNRATRRIFGSDRFTTAISISHEAYPNGVDTVYVANGIGDDGNGSPDAIVGGTLTDGPVLLMNPQSPESIRQVADEISRFNPKKVFMLGGKVAISDSAAKEMAGYYSWDRLAGADRYETSVMIAKRAFPTKEREGNAEKLLSDIPLYLARGDNFVDALVGGSLKDGPLLLARADSAVSAPAAEYLKNLLPNKVYALGGPNALHSDAIDIFVNAIKEGL